MAVQNDHAGGAIIVRDAGREADLLENRLDVDVVLDGHVEAGDGCGGDGEVDAKRHLAVLLHQLLQPPRERHP